MLQEHVVSDSRAECHQIPKMLVAINIFEIIIIFIHKVNLSCAGPQFSEKKIGLLVGVLKSLVSKSKCFIYLCVGSRMVVTKKYTDDTGNMSTSKHCLFTCDCGTITI